VGWLATFFIAVVAHQDSFFGPGEAAHGVPGGVDQQPMDPGCLKNPTSFKKKQGGFRSVKLKGGHFFLVTP